MKFINKKISLTGEMLVDLVISNDFTIKPYPGGSVFNTANTLSKLGAFTEFYSMVGDDLWGKYLLDFMSAQGMVISGIMVSKDKKTPLAFALCDEHGNATYDFYKTNFNDKIELKNLSVTGIFHFGSFFSIIKDNYHVINKIFDASKKIGFLTSYDPNYRKGFEQYKSNTMKNLRRADIIRASMDDMISIFNIGGLDEAFETLEKFSAILVIITLGKDGSAARIKGRPYIKIPSIKTEVVDTIGAGDNFSAGYLYHLYINKIFDVHSLRLLTDDFIFNMLSFASAVTAESVKVKGAGIDKEKLISLKKLQFT